DLIIIAARPSMGKTALALNVVQHAAIEHNVPVAIFSLEMSKEQLVQQLLCSEGLVDAQRLRRGQLRDDDYPKLARAAGLLGTARRSSAGVSIGGLSSPICANRARSSRTPTSCASSIGRSSTTGRWTRRRTRTSKAWRSWPWASSATVTPAA